MAGGFLGPFLVCSFVVSSLAPPLLVLVGWVVFGLWLLGFEAIVLFASPESSCFPCLPMIGKASGVSSAISLATTLRSMEE